MGLFGGNYNRPGPGVPKDAPPKKGIPRFFEMLTRDYAPLWRTGFVTMLCFVPLVFSVTVIYAFLGYLIPMLIGAVLYAVSYTHLRVLHEADERFGRAAVPQGRAQRFDDGVVRAERLLAAAQHARAAAFEAQRRGVARDVGAALVDDGDDAHRHAHAAQRKAVFERALLDDLTHRIGQSRDGAHAVRHGSDALRREQQAVDHHRGDDALGARDVLGVGGEDIACVRLKTCLLYTSRCV